MDSIVQATAEATPKTRYIAETAEGQRGAFGELRERISVIDTISSRNRTDAGGYHGQIRSHRNVGYYPLTILAWSAYHCSL